MTPMLGIMASSISGSKVATGAFYSISTATVTSGGTTSVTFSSIPSTYTHLQLRISAQVATTANCVIRLNGDSGTNYMTHYLEATGGSSISAGAISSGTSFSGGVYSADSNVFSGQIIDILDYTNVNKNKVIRNLSGFDRNGTLTWLDFSSGLWLNTAAITSISITNNLNQYSSFALYGVK